jgi:hypothetical protein
MPEHRCQQAVHAAGGRRGQALLEQRPAERRQMLGADIPDVHVPEGCADAGRPGLPGEQAADTGLRVTPFRREPDVDRLGDRLLLSAGEAREMPEGFGAGAAGGRVDDAPLALLADEPLAAARDPLVARMATAFRDGGHGRESYHTRTYPRTYGGRDDR